MDDSKPEEIYLSVNGIKICCFRWGDPDGRALLLVHATGFHARCWDEVVAHLPSDWNIVSVDMRGHGRSEKQGPYGWAQFGSDLNEVTSQLDIKKAIGVGHSMGGYCVTEVAYLSPDVFSDLVLVDPVIRPPDAYDSQTAVPDGSVEDHPIARRRSQFESWVEMYDRYEQRSPYSLWQRQVFEDYCRHGVIPAREGSGLSLHVLVLLKLPFIWETMSPRYTNSYPRFLKTQ
ncbi:MAG: alpha/beta fold hydrolase [Candidatus Azotimanducaceae bacterium]